MIEGGLRARGRPRRLRPPTRRRSVAASRFDGNGEVEDSPSDVAEVATSRSRREPPRSWPSAHAARSFFDELVRFRRGGCRATSEGGARNELIAAVRPRRLRTGSRAAPLTSIDDVAQGAPRQTAVPTRRPPGRLAPRVAGPSFSAPEVDPAEVEELAERVAEVLLAEHAATASCSATSWPPRASASRISSWSGLRRNRELPRAVARGAARAAPLRGARDRARRSLRLRASSVSSSRCPKPSRRCAASASRRARASATGCACARDRRSLGSAQPHGHDPARAAHPRRARSQLRAGGRRARRAAHPALDRAGWPHGDAASATSQG